MPKTFYIETFGCQMNKNDSELMSRSLLEHGFRPSEGPDDADITVFNTCSVRDHAENRVLSRIRSCRKKVRDRGGIIVVAGCMAQRIGGDLAEKGIADVVIGPYQTPDAGRLVARYLAERGPRVFLSQDARDFRTRINPALARAGGRPEWHRWVTITHGCENFCSYCIVPFVRGRLISFPSADILAYIRLLAESGAREITLLGQNVNQYGTDSGDIPFYRLLESAALVPGIERVNFITSHPKDFTEEILHVIRDHPNIARSIHLPLQSGSDRILERMNRGYVFKNYMGIVEKINAILPDHALSTDLIVGFPGETEDEFNGTLRAVESIRFDDAFTYAYSPREGTPAFPLAESLSREEKIARLERLIALQRGIRRQKLSARVGREEDIIVEGFSKKAADSVRGMTWLGHTAVLPGSAGDIGKKIRIKIEGVSGATLRGARLA